MTATSVEIQESDKPEKEAKIGCNVFVLSLAEMLGLATIMFIGCAGCISGAYPNKVVEFSPFSFGLAVALAIQLFGHISGGHFNPSVTVAAYIMGKIELGMVPFYLISQFVGAIVGYGLLILLIPSKHTDGLCVTSPQLEITEIQALFVEVIITALLVLACCSLWDKRTSAFGDSVPIRLGLMLSSIFIAAAPFTGASINPARSFAPALFQNKWDAHWIYWLGPMLGGVIGSLLYRYSFIDGLSKIGSKED